MTYLSKPGLGLVGAYQVSGIPFATSSLAVPATGSALYISFPRVTRTIIVTNTISGSNALRLGFSELGVTVGTNYYVVLGGETITTDVKCTGIYLSSDTGTPISASVLAELTFIETQELPNNWSGSLGVG